MKKWFYPKNGYTLENPFDKYRLMNNLQKN